MAIDLPTQKIKYPLLLLIPAFLALLSSLPAHCILRTKRIILIIYYLSTGAYAMFAIRITQTNGLDPILIGAGDTAQTALLILSSINQALFYSGHDVTVFRPEGFTDNDTGLTYTITERAPRKPLNF